VCLCKCVQNHLNMFQKVAQQQFSFLLSNLCSQDFEVPPITIWCMLIVVMYGVCVLGTDQQSERRCRVHQRALHDRGGEEQSADQVCPDTRLFLIISLTVNVL